MINISFNDTYIAVVPEYVQPGSHKHNMLHVFFGNDELTIETEAGVFSGKNLILDKNVRHKGPVGHCPLFLFVDSTSGFYEILKNEYLKGKPCVAFDTEKAWQEDMSFPALREWISSFFGQEALLRRTSIDERISLLLSKIDSYRYNGAKVAEIATDFGYSESYLTHLFKKETHVSLKNYLLMKQFEYVWRRISVGDRITETVMDAGFSTPSHFSDLCKKLTGISAMDVLKKADF